MNLLELRKEFIDKGLGEADVHANPIHQFREWFEVVLAAEVHLADAMTLATATPDGKPSARLVLLKGFDERGFVFFTNYESRKGKELTANPQAALVFHWKEVERQVRIEGLVETITVVESDSYFYSRPRESQASACVSRQSHVIPNRDDLERRCQELMEHYRGQNIPRPHSWGGYRVLPSVIEFWQGRPNRLHDRLCYLRQGDGSWRIERLSP
jgi:pyridoxamine 5'-phosphate oxidase